MALSHQIDQLLTILNNGDYYQLFNESSDEEYQAVDKAIAYKLIREKGSTYSLTERGYEVISAGGFEQWKTLIGQREQEAHQATLDSAKATVDAARSAKLSKYAAYVSALAAIVAIALPPLLPKEPEANKSDVKCDSLTNDIRVKHDTIYLPGKGPSQTLTTKAVPSQTQKKK